MKKLFFALLSILTIYGNQVSAMENVTKQEFIEKFMKDRFDEDSYKFMFEMSDINKDAYVSTREVYELSSKDKEAMQKIGSLLQIDIDKELEQDKIIFHQTDTNKDNLLDMQEFANFFKEKIQQTVETEFYSFDTNHDDIIESQEFENHYKNMLDELKDVSLEDSATDLKDTVTNLKDNKKNLMNIRLQAQHTEDWHMMNKNKDTCVDVDECAEFEYNKYQRTCNEYCSEDKTLDTFKEDCRVTLENDNKLSCLTLDEYIKNISKTTDIILTGLTADNSEETELQKILNDTKNETEDITQTLFNILDINKDNCVSLDEYCEDTSSDSECTNSYNDIEKSNPTCFTLEDFKKDAEKTSIQNQQEDYKQMDTDNNNCVDENEYVDYDMKYYFDMGITSHTKDMAKDNYLYIKKATPNCLTAEEYLKNELYSHQEVNYLKMDTNYDNCVTQNEYIASMLQIYKDSSPHIIKFHEERYAKIQKANPNCLTLDEHTEHYNKITEGLESGEAFEKLGEAFKSLDELKDKSIQFMEENKEHSDKFYKEMGEHSVEYFNEDNTVSPETFKEEEKTYNRYEQRAKDKYKTMDTNNNNCVTVDEYLTSEASEDTKDIHTEIFQEIQTTPSDDCLTEEEYINYYTSI